ncbi:hypothetical protein AB6C57_22445 [Vibrio splendidus]
MNNSKKIIVIDGYDGTGKTTLSQNLATALGGKYIKPFLQSGIYIRRLHEKGYFREAHLLASISIEESLKEEYVGNFAIIDRHWLSMSVFAGEDGSEIYEPRPLTIMCDAEIKTIEKRLLERGEELIGDNQLSFINKYRYLANRNNIPIIRTDTNSESESLSIALNIVTSQYKCL